jgi:hypothetical protein
MPTSIAAAASSKPVAHAFREVLAEEGYRPKVEGGEDETTTTRIAFKSEGTRFTLYAYEDDPEYFRLAAAYDLGEGPHDGAGLASIANHVNEHVKAVKTVLDLDRNGVRFIVETFLTGQKVTPALIERATSALRAAANDFFAARRPPGHFDA